MDTAQAVARQLLEIGAVKLQPDEPFTWASGLRSPIYCDNRITLSYPQVRHFLQDAFVAQASEIDEFDGIAGVATAGIPHGVLLAERLKLPFIYIRSSAKSHGRQNQIEGDISQAKRYLVIEDLISTGSSSLAAVEALRAAGGQIRGIMAVFTYGFPRAEEACAAANCPAWTLSNYPTLLRVAIERQYIDSAQAELLSEWRVDPAAWSKKITK
jgi:orotate phosphoribosyltransferase